MLEKFGGQKLFSVNEARLVEPGFHRPRLNDWLKKGYIKKFVRNYYILSSFTPDERFLFSAANRIYEPSYISTQSALSSYGLIPDRPVTVTSITTRKTKNFNTPFGRFIYRKCLVKHFWGYSEDGGFLMASPSKALLDLIYLDASLRSKEAIAELRLDTRRFFSMETKKGLIKSAEKMGDTRVMETVREAFL